MIEDHQLASLLVKIEMKIDTFLKKSNVNPDLANNLKESIREKLSIIGFSR